MDPATRAPVLIAGFARQVQSADQKWDGSHSYRFSGSDSNYETNHFSNGDHVGDKVSSIKNNTGYWVAFFKHDTYAGDAICVAPRTNVYDVGDFNVNHDLNQPFESLEDEISSHLRYSSKPRAWNVGGPCDKYIGGWTGRRAGELSVTGPVALPARPSPGWRPREGPGRCTSLRRWPARSPNAPRRTSDDVEQVDPEVGDRPADRGRRAGNRPR